MGRPGARRHQAFQRLDMAHVQREAIAAAERDPINWEALMKEDDE